MFKNHSCNLKPKESLIRFVLGTLILIYAIYSSHFIVTILTLYFYYTAYKKFCFVYYLFKINDKLSIENYYLTFLPKYNPSAVFIFDMKGQVLFKNEAASSDITCIHSILDIDIQRHEDIIKNDALETVIFECHEVHYQIQLQGISKEKFLLAYLTDVTEVIELNDEIESTQREVIYTMGEIGERRSRETGHHVKRVAKYSKLLALLYGLDEAEADMLKIASPMHDIGKVGIPDSVLNAPRKLNLQEWKIMQTHAELGYEMLKSSEKPILKAAAIVAREHHEKWDGSGYPRALSGEDIHIYGRITAVADVFDALGSDRVYKEAWELDDILELFKEQSGKHFDPQLVGLFMSNLDDFLVIRDRFRD
jgi:HD-GYP domain-containing protein (c-di-GMP phosphodiesterase class II)